MQTLMRRQFAKRRRSVSNNCINGTRLVDHCKFLLVEKRTLVPPIDIGGQRFIRIRQMVLPDRHAPQPVDRDCASDTEDSVSASFHHGIVGQRHPAFVSDRLEVEVGGIVVVPANEHQPVVGFREPFAAFIVQCFIIPWPFKAKTAVARHDNQRVGHAIFHTALIDELREVPVDVATHHDTLRLRKLVCIHFFHLSNCESKHFLFLLFIVLVWEKGEMLHSN